MSNRSIHGFSLIEVMFVIAILGTLLTMAIPTLTGFRASSALKGASENVAGQIRLARSKAMATDSTQTIHFDAYLGSDYHIHNGGVVGPMWNLPKGISFAGGTAAAFALGPTGRATPSGLVILQDTRGNLDTVSVLQSGLVLVK